MAEDWRTDCWKAERELEEYKGTIVPALIDRIKELENQEAAGLRIRERTYMNAFIRYGETNQAVVAMEELSECQKEIAKFIRGIGNAGALAEEVADALICLEQVMMIYGIREMVQIQMDRKVMRLEDKLRREAMPSQSPAVTALPGGEPKGVKMHERL